MTLPNLITIIRLLLVPAIVSMILSGEWLSAFILFTIAGISDGVDGYIARRFDMKSELGSYLDALADKILLVTIYGSLAIQGVLPMWLAVIVIFRDVLILIAIVLSWLLARPVTIRPLRISKVNTAAQIALAAVSLGFLGLGIAQPQIITLGVLTVAALTGLSAGAYLLGWLRHMA